MSLLLDSCPGGLLLEPPEPATSKFDYLALSQKLYSNLTEPQKLVYDLSLIHI